MAATGKTPILLYGSTTATNQPSAGNLTNSSDGCEIAINVADKNLFFKDSTNTVNTVPIRQSSASSNGWLSSTDWSTFNGKVSSQWTTSGSNIYYTTGSVGVGTNSPQTPLDVVSSSSSAYGVQIRGRSSDGIGILTFAANNGTTVNGSMGHYGTDFLISQKLAYSLKFYTSDTERMQIYATGGVSIGNTTDPGATNLSVTGVVLTGGASGSYNIFSKASTSTSFGIWNNSATTPEGLNVYLGGVTNSSSAQFFRGNDSTNNRIIIYGTGTVSNSTGTYNAFSDIKLKENVVDATPKLKDILKLRVVNFNLKEQPELKQIGFIAQEIEQVFPNLVEDFMDRDIEGNALDTYTKSVKLSVLVPILVKAIQEQQQQITELQTKILALGEK